MRLAVLADIHGNLSALQAVIADMAGRRIDAVVNLGDCASGPLWPAETLAVLRALAWPTVRGNHDRHVGLDDPATLGRTDAFTRDALDDAGRAWLAALPVRLRLPGDVVAFHARPDDDAAYLLEDVVAGRLAPADRGAVAARLGSATAALVLCAHSHRAALLQLPDGRTVLNPGSVGCPAYDDPARPAHVSEAGHPAARYAVVERRPDGRLAAELLAIPYDHAAAAARAEACGRPDWAHALATGCMPPEDGGRSA